MASRLKTSVHAHFPRLAAVACGAALAACQPQSNTPATAPTVDMGQVRSDLTTIAGARVYFAHQSVGRNILAGMAMLMSETGVTLRVEEIKDGAPAPAGPGFYHANVGENGIADSKLAAFVADVTTTASAPYDLALLKFCYTDLGADARDHSAAELLARYQRTMADVQSRLPGLTLLHTTMPLLAEPPGKKTRLKRLLGMEVSTDADNILRGEYNRALRSKVPADSLFDVAKLEATEADGTLVTFTADGRKVEMMAAAQTNDGGHLTDAAKRQVAAAFLHTIAEALRHRATGEAGAATS